MREEEEREGKEGNTALYCTVPARMSSMSPPACLCVLGSLLQALLVVLIASPPDHLNRNYQPVMFSEDRVGDWIE
jgi:hypothetical protein